MNEHKINLDKERVLKFSNRSFMELERRLGKPIVSIFTETALQKTTEEKTKVLISLFSSSQFITDFIYCGLMHEKEPLSYDQVIDIIPVKQYMEIMTLAMTVITDEFGYSSKSKSGAGKKKE